jgi:hypothetical protein
LIGNEGDELDGNEKGWSSDDLEGEDVREVGDLSVAVVGCPVES